MNDHATKLAFWDDWKQMALEAGVAVPLAVGSGGGCVLLPEDWRRWDDPKLRAVLAHEMSHLRRHDWSIQLWSVAARSLFWFHPLAWWLERHLRALAISGLAHSFASRFSIASTVTPLPRSLWP